MERDTQKRSEEDARKRVGGLLVEKFAPRQVAEGERFEYRVRLTNVADKTVPSVVLVESLLYSLNIEEADPPSSVGEAHTARWTLGPLIPDQEVTVRVVCTARRAMWFRSYTSVSYALET